MNEKYIILFVSFVIAVLGWVFSAYINNRAFNRAETSKLKDKIVLLSENFFDELDKMVTSRNTKESDLDDLTTEWITIIEFQLKYLKQKNGLILIEDEDLKKMRSLPYDFILENLKPIKNLRNLKLDILENIEKNYTDWYFNQKIMFFFKEKLSCLFKRKLA